MSSRRMAWTLEKTIRGGGGSIIDVNQAQPAWIISSLARMEHTLRSRARSTDHHRTREEQRWSQVSAEMGLPFHVKAPAQQMAIRSHATPPACLPALPNPLHIST